MNYGEFLSSFLIDLQRLFRMELPTKDLSYSQILAIISIPDSGIEMSELSFVLGLDNSTVTRLVMRLENKLWVERKRSRRDQRAVKVCLTDKGIKIQQSLEKKIEGIGQKINLEVKEADKESLLNSLSSFQWILKKIFLNK
tara:strand:+ start:629 stop:1051 length:423 start_codon:yes stop_codon:yes gene_type:complete